MNDLEDSQLAYAHECMVSNLLSPYSSTLAMQAQNVSGGCEKLIVLGFINTEDNEATEQKTELMALGSSPGLAHHPKTRMGVISYILPRVFELSDSKLGPAGPIAVNDPAAKLRELAARLPPRLLTTAVDV